jgi:hypothetical protein
LNPRNQPRGGLHPAQAVVGELSRAYHMLGDFGRYGDDHLVTRGNHDRAQSATRTPRAGWAGE